MTQEEKQLLLVDLCARLPYKVIVNYNGLAQPLFNISPTQHFQITLDNALDGEHNGLVYVSLDVDGEKPKPYLRPMSSMTDEEIDIMWNISENYSEAEGSSKITDLLNKWNLDHHHLIEKGLAIAVTEENNPYKD